MSGGGGAIDLGYLNRETFRDRALAGELLALLSAQLDELGPAALSDDPARRAVALHTLRGAAGAVGATDLAEAAKRLEDGDDAASVEHLAVAIERTAAELHALRSGPGGVAGALERFETLAKSAATS